MANLNDEGMPIAFAPHQPFWLYEMLTTAIARHFICQCASR